MNTKTANPHAAPLITQAPIQAQVRQKILLLAAGGLLQTSAETLALGNAGPLSPGKALLIFCTSTSGIFLLWLGIWQPMIGAPGPSRFFQHSSLPREQAGRTHLLPKILNNGLLALLLLALVWSAATNGTLLLQHPLDPAIYDSDAAAFVHYQAEDVLHGTNPYTDTTGFWHALAQFPAAGATPLQRGQFVGLPFSPPDQAVIKLLHIYLRHPTQAGPEFDPASLHSYPAGAFLLAVPFIWAGLPSTQPLYALSLFLLFGLLTWWTPSGARWYTLLMLASLSLAITLTLRSSFEIICILCVVAAWRLQARHPTLSALLPGLGCAVKQLTWLFVPFYLLWIIKSAGWRQAAKSSTLALLVFLLINAPFLIASPAAWASSMLLPITEPTFPGGIGLITLAQGNILPLPPAWAFTTLEVTAYLGVLLCYAISLKAGKPPGIDSPSPARHLLTANQTANPLGLFLAPLPLLLASRSLISYTMFLPVLALAALLQMQDTPVSPTLQQASIAPPTQKDSKHHER